MIELDISKIEEDRFVTLVKEKNFLLKKYKNLKYMFNFNLNHCMTPVNCKEIQYFQNTNRTMVFLTPLHTCDEIYTLKPFKNIFGIKNIEKKLIFNKSRFLEEVSNLVLEDNDYNDRNLVNEISCCLINKSNKKLLKYNVLVKITFDENTDLDTLNKNIGNFYHE